MYIKPCKLTELSPVYFSVMFTAGCPRLPANSCWISFKLLPLVSGTTRNTNTTPSTVRPAKSQKVPPDPMPAFRFLNVFVIIKAKSQLVVPAIEPAKPLISVEKSSPIISHGTGPYPMENIIINTHKLTTGNHPRFSTLFSSWSFKKK